ncbi:transposase [Rhodopirellula baltica]
MPRFPRLQYEIAIYHIVARGDGRRKLFHDQGHYDRFTKGLVDEVDRSGWGVIAYCWMSDHIHALITPPPVEPLLRHAALTLRLCQLVRQAEPSNGALVPRPVQVLSR